METPWTSQVLAAALATARTTSLAAALLVAGLLAAHATGLLAAVAQRGRLLLERLIAGETLRGYLAGFDGGAHGATRFVLMLAVAEAALLRMPAAFSKIIS